MVTNNSINTPFPIDVPSGGTGLSSATAYAILCGGTTSTSAIQSVSGVGTSGQVLTSNGAGSLPSWQTNSGGGDFSYIETQTGSGSSAITFTSTVSGTYINYRFVGKLISTSTNNDTLICEVSDDGGSTWKTTNYSGYNWFWNSATFARYTSSTAMLIAPSATYSNAAGATGSFTFDVLNIGSSTLMSCLGESSFPVTGGSGAGGSINTVCYTTASTLNAFRFRFTSGNISGTIYSYGFSN